MHACYVHVPQVIMDHTLLAHDHHREAQHQSYQRSYKLASKYPYRTVEKVVLN